MPFLLLLPAVGGAAEAGKIPVWKWTLADGKVVHLVGSIHLLKDDAYPLPEKMEAAFKAADAVAFETDIGQLNSPELQAKILMKGVYTDGSVLTDHIDTETKKLLTEYLQTKGTDIAGFNKMRPWYVGMVLALLDYVAKGFNPALGLDQHYFNRAVRDGKKTVPLEDAMFQLDLLSQLGGGDGNAFLKETLVDLTNQPEQADELYEAWKVGDGETIAKQMNDSIKRIPDAYEMLLVKRNRDWIPKIRKLAAENQSPMVVVGAGHLVGEESVVDLLQKEGEKVEQLSK